MYQAKNYSTYFKEYLKLGLPMMIGSMTVALIASGDIIMISKLGSNITLAAVQVANQICNVALLFIIGNSTILAPLVAKAIVHDNYRDATKSLQHVIALNLLFAFISTLIILGFSSILDKFGQPQQVIALTKGYLRIIAISIIPYSVSFAIKRYLDALGWTLHTMVLSVLAGLTNIILNYIFIYGKLGVPALGLNGAGWATLITRILFLFIHISYLFIVKNKGQLIPLSPQLFEKSFFIKVFKLGFPSGLDLAVKMGYYAIAMFMFGKCNHGEIAQASTGFLFSILRFALMPPLAVCSSSSILISKSWARKNKPAILRIAKTGYIIAFAMMPLMGGLIYTFYPKLFGLYQSTSSVEYLITSVIGLVILFHFSDGLNLVSVGMLRGLQDTLIPFILSAFAYLGIGIPVGYITAYYMNYQEIGIWIGLISGMAASLCLLSLRFYYKLRHIKFPSQYISI